MAYNQNNQQYPNNPNEYNPNAPYQGPPYPPQHQGGYPYQQPNPNPNYLQQGYIPPNQVSPEHYAPTSNQNLSNNQNQQLAYIAKELKSSPKLVTCPYCHQLGTTMVKSEFSWASCCLCYWGGLIIWLIVQLCREKDINCTDAQHSCASCGNLIHRYESC